MDRFFPLAQVVPVIRVNVILTRLPLGKSGGNPQTIRVAPTDATYVCEESTSPDIPAIATVRPMREFLLKTLQDVNRFVVSMDTSDWTLAFMVVVGFGFFCMRGVGSKSKV